MAYSCFDFEGTTGKKTLGLTLYSDSSSQCGHTNLRNLNQPEDPPTSLRLLEAMHSSPSNLVASELHDRYLNRLLRLAEKKILPVLRAKVAAEDIAQEAFVTFFEKVRAGSVEWSSEGDLWRFLAGIARKKILKTSERFSAGKRALSAEDDGRTVAHTSQEAMEIEAVDLGDFIDHLLAGENALLREVLIGKLAGFTQAEIAQHIGRSERTCRRLLESLRAKIVLQNHVLNVSVLTANTHSIAAPHQSTLDQIALPTIKHDDFRLLRFIGEGTFGKVYFAQGLSDHLPRQLAIKVLKREWLSVDAIVRRFGEEIRCHSQLRHPHIAKIYACGYLKNGTPFLGSEYMPFTLADLNQTAANQQQILAQIQEAIAFVHSKGMTHGDLKLSNIGVSDRGHGKLLDFGLTQPTNTENNF